MYSKCLLLALILFFCPHPGWTTKAEELASLEANIVDMMTRMEVKDEVVAFLVADKELKDQRIALLEDAMEAKDHRFAVLEDAVETLEKAAITKDILMFY